MKTIYINLERDTEKNKTTKSLFPQAERITAVDGLVETEQTILPFKASKSWRDPYHNRRLTAGEVGCFLSHYRTWKKCIEDNEDYLILEDDLNIVNSDYYREIQLASAMNSNIDLIYLSSKPLRSYRQEISKNLETAGYCYWTSAYYLSVEGAKKLVQCAETHHEIIPVDEFLPACIGEHHQANLNEKFGCNLNALRFKNSILLPKAGAFDFSSTENSPIWSSVKVHLVTVATDVKKAKYLLESSPIPVTNIGEGVEWKGGNMAAGPGGGQKVNLLKNHIQNIPDEDLILFLDGYDTCIFDSIRSIIERYLSFKKEIVFAAEKLCWPDTSLAPEFETPENGYKYLNSGSFIGTNKELKALLEPSIQDHEDDQYFYQKQFLSGEYNACLDHEGYIFTCLSGIEDKIIFRGRQLINTETQCSSSILHGNGGQSSKKQFEALCKNVTISSKTYSIAKQEYRDIHFVDKDIILLHNFLPREYCIDLIEAGEEMGSWNPLDKDAYPGQEVRLRNLPNREFLDVFYQAYRSKIVPVAEKIWKPMRMHDIRDLFIIKYSMDSQRNLPLHHDMSLISGSMKLNEEYEGAELEFPRQGISNKDFPVGSIVLWPSSVTHPHRCNDLISGNKYSLTMWTGRDPNDKEPL